MNPNTRELISYVEAHRRLQKDKSALEGFYPVPNELEELAQEELQGCSSVVLPKDHPITIAVKRINKKAKRKAVKEARRKNRR